VTPVNGCLAALPHLTTNGGALITVGSEVSDSFAPLMSIYVAYPWSSYAAHALGELNLLLSELPCWSLVGTTEEGRQVHWRTWVQTPLSERELAGVRRSVTSGRPFGAAPWVEIMAATLGVRLEARPRGRPRKNAPPRKMN